jgi:lysozyme family protein
MAASNFDASLKLVLQSEGGNDDDPADHGGRTSRGITQREYDAWRTEEQLPKQDVWQAPQSDIIAIYHDEYWMPWCDLIPVGTDYVFFDMGVNAGPNRAIILGQRALGVPADGRVGPVTRAAFRAAQADPAKLLDAYTAQKIAFYRSLHQPRFTKGWLNRAKEVHDAALKMIAGSSKTA